MGSDVCKSGVSSAENRPNYGTSDGRSRDLRNEIVGRNSAVNDDHV